MAVTIVGKGETVALKGKNTVSKAVVGLGWDTNEGQSASAFDLDASVVARDASGTAVLVAYYQDKDPAAWVHHTGDNLTGDGDGDDEQIEIDLSAVPEDIVRLDVVVHIYDGPARQQNFGMVESAFVRIARSDAPDTDVLRSDLSNTGELFDATGVLFASLKRNGPTWDFESVVDGSAKHATLSDSSQP